MSAITSATDSIDLARRILEVSSQALSEGHITPEVVTARDTASAQLEAQTNILKEAIAAETQVLNLLI